MTCYIGINKKQQLFLYFNPVSKGKEIKCQYFALISLKTNFLINIKRYVKHVIYSDFIFSEKCMLLGLWILNCVIMAFYLH